MKNVLDDASNDVASHSPPLLPSHHLIAPHDMYIENNNLVLNHDFT